MNIKKHWSWSMTKSNEENPDIGKEVLRGVVKLPVDEVIALPLEDVEKRIILLGLGRDDLHKFEVETFSYTCVGSMLGQDEEKTSTKVFLLFEIAGVLKPLTKETEKKRKKAKKKKKRFWW